MRMRGFVIAAAVALFAAASAPSWADTEVTTDQPGALLIFPKVVVDGTRDTIIQISNASGSIVLARCFYTSPEVDSDSGELVWLTVDFQISLTRLQPTMWLASEGRPVTPVGRPPELEPGPVPPLAGFLGELRCVVVNATEQPISRNVLTGSATIVDRSVGEARRYQAISIKGLPKNNGDNALLLNDVEYSTCPRMLLLNHFFDSAFDPALSVPMQTTLTVVPCSADYENGVPGTALLQFDVVNEFEQRLSARLSVRCFADTALAAIDSPTNPERSIFNIALQGTLVGQTRIRPVPDGDSTAGHGVVGIAEEFHGPPRGGTAINLHFIPGNLQGDRIVLPGIF